MIERFFHHVQLEQEVLQSHAQLANSGDTAASKRELDRKLDDIVQFNRTTVWREQAQFERNRLNVNVSSGGENAAPWMQRPTGRLIILTASLFVFALLLSLPTMEHRNQRNCLAMIVLLTILWVTEVIPLYVTSMLVPVLVVLLGVLPKHRHPDESMHAQKAAHRVFEVRFLIAPVSYAACLHACS